MSRDEIFQKIQEVLDDALGVDEDEVTPESSLTSDLGAESIDFLDIVFRIEKTFDFKISQGELFPENLTENPPSSVFAMGSSKKWPLRQRHWGGFTVLK